MPAVILGLMKESHVSMKEISEKSHVPFSTLNNAAKKPIENWSIRVLNAFATGLNKSASDLLEILQPQNYQLNIDNRNQTIQDVFIPDKELFQQIRFVVESEHLEGWNPTSKDIKYLLNAAKNPDPKMVAEAKDLFGDQVDGKRLDS
ncbi:MAG: helix-turn-helix transcriptional regulator [Lactobacillus sp.]|jgi:hypothetical protein|nr:helix-turn-helix transcriptional regulator [Lactobacillus sp.]MCH3906359.1 helix-turn-helix transcriptional regulator [Lactobacillus sp.]MCH3990067.1 helix-turn-helix transcriptional regulator [Lactobacillus sp.]MCH4069219.1 helix-turn-helix transcriptional regulator [Lactobacillus sp.]MCI1303521.1 helix-turn-helix transcriptional regulator [Lactobacillus sp.]